MPTTRPSLIDRVFELRMLAAILFAVYGIVCTIWGIGFTTSRELAKAGGINVNLWAGLAMIVAAIAFAVWALARPLVPRGDRVTAGDQA